MSKFLFLIKEHHILTILFGLLSAFFWILSAFVKSKISPKRITLTFGTETEMVDLHNFVDTVKKQSRLNSIAAIFAALTAVSQVLGF